MLQKVDQSPHLTGSNLLTDFFSGKVEGTGMIIDRFGKIRQHVIVAMNGYWRGVSFCMDETFTYQDGKTEERRWIVTFTEGEEFVANSPDLDAPAIGCADQNTVEMSYKFPVPIASRPVRLNFDDRMYLLDENTLYERAVMKKFGIRVADIILVFRKT